MSPTPLPPPDGVSPIGKIGPPPVEPAPAFLNSQTTQQGDGVEVFKYVKKGSSTTHTEESIQGGSDASIAPLGVLQNAAHYVLNQTNAVPPGFNNCFVYTVRSVMGGSDFAGTSILIHHLLFTSPQMKVMVDECIEICKGLRLWPRRKAAKVPPDDKIDGINEAYFKTDHQFLEALMCDKFDFRVVVTTHYDGVIDPTIVRPAK